MVNNSTNINQNHLSPSTHWVMVNNSTNINKITSHYQLIEWCQQFHQYQQKSPLTFNSLSDGQQFHQYQQKSPLTFNSLSDGQQFHQYQQKSPLTIQLIEWCQQFHQYQQKSPLTSELIEWWSIITPISTRWFLLKITSHLNSLKWWSTIPPISTKITSHLNSLSDGQQFHQYQQKSPLTSIHWVMVNNSTNINNNHHSPQLIKWWSTIPPISTKITSHLYHIEWWSTISTNINNNHLSP